MEHVVIEYMRIPDEIAKDFASEVDNSIHIKLVKSKEYESFTGGPADIIIYIKEHLTEILVGAIVGPAVYDSIKFSISRLWKKLISFYSRKRTIEEDKNCISLNIEFKNEGEVEFILSGSVKEKEIQEIINGLFDYLKAQNRIKTDLMNSDYQDKDSTKPKITMRFNEETKSWEPVNVVQLRKQFDELLKNASMGFDN